MHSYEWNKKYVVLGMTSNDVSSVGMEKDNILWVLTIGLQVMKFSPSWNKQEPDRLYVTTIAGPAGILEILKY